MTPTTDAAATASEGAKTMTLQPETKPLKHYRWRWVRDRDGKKLYGVWLEPDNTLHNPNGYDEQEARAAVLRADSRTAERLSEAARAAAETRRRRQDARIYDAARLILSEAGIGQSKYCYCCHKLLTDPASIARSIGSECWQHVLDHIAVMKMKTAEEADNTP
jgi:hypothetical protein